jgi:hypothetical protein
MITGILIMGCVAEPEESDEEVEVLISRVLMKSSIAEVLVIKEGSSFCCSAV